MTKSHAILTLNRPLLPYALLKIAENTWSLYNGRILSIIRIFLGFYLLFYISIDLSFWMYWTTLYIQSFFQKCIVAETIFSKTEINKEWCVNFIKLIPLKLNCLIPGSFTLVKDLTNSSFDIVWSFGIEFLLESSRSSNPTFEMHFQFR